MNLRRLEFLRLVIARGGFAKAADSAGVSQPAISLSMQTLERELGFPLFEKQGRHKRPTARAIAFARASGTLTSALTGLSTAPKAVPRAAAERLALRVGMAPAAGLLYSPLIYATLRQYAPDQALRIVTGHAPGMLEQLLGQALDLVIAPLPRRFALEHLRRHLMYIGDPAIYARVGHPLASASALAQIARAQWVVAGAAGTPGNVIEEAFRVRRWPPPRVVVQCADYAMLVRLVAGSDLLGVVSNPALVQEPQRLGVRALSILEGLPRYEVCLFWSDEHVASRGLALARVLDALRRQAPPG